MSLIAPRRLFFKLLAPVVVLFALVSGLTAQAAQTRSTRDGVFTAAQAERGKIVFEEGCTECHTARMWGTDWNGKSVGDVYDFISQYMPEPAPGSLNAQQVRDVISFILSSNRLPAGAAELPASLDAMKAIKLEPPPQ